MKITEKKEGECLFDENSHRVNLKDVVDGLRHDLNNYFGIIRAKRLRCLLFIQDQGTAEGITVNEWTECCEPLEQVINLFNEFTEYLLDEDTCKSLDDLLRKIEAFANKALFALGNGLSSLRSFCQRQGLSDSEADGAKKTINKYLFDLIKECERSLAVLPVLIKAYRSLLEASFVTSIELRPIAQLIQDVVGANNLTNRVVVNLTPTVEDYRVPYGVLFIILSNLLLNAEKYGDSGKSIQVNVADEGPDGFCRIEVKNFGEGLSKEEIDRLLAIKTGRLERHNSSGIPGTGIGLHIVKICIHHLQGKLGIESDGRSYVTFWIAIPIIQSH